MGLQEEIWSPHQQEEDPSLEKMRTLIKRNNNAKKSQGAISGPKKAQKGSEEKKTLLSRAATSAAFVTSAKVTSKDKRRIKVRPRDPSQSLAL